jgi:hypothetical protein
MTLAVKNFLKLFAEITILAILAFIVLVSLHNNASQPGFLMDHPKSLKEESLASSPEPNMIHLVPYPLPREQRTPEILLPKPPECTFDNWRSFAQPENSPFETYQFSEPKIVFTSTHAIHLANWLPDSQRLLAVIDSHDGAQAVEILDTRSGATRLYGYRGDTGGKPIWINSLQAVIYPSFESDHQELFISPGDPQNIQDIYPNIYGPSLSSNGRQLVFSSPPSDMPQIWDADTQEIRSTELNLAGWDVNKFPKNSPKFSVPGMRFIATMNPVRSLVAFGSYGTLLLGDLSSKKICEVILGSNGSLPISMISAVWSPNGQYLAMITTAHYPGQAARYSKLSVLDISTGKQNDLDLPFPLIEDITWGADNRTLAVLGLMKEDLKVGSNAVSRLFVVDMPGRRYKMLFPDRHFGGGTIIGWQLSWSPDNRWIAVKCPLVPDPYQPFSEDRVCLVKVSS